MKAQPLSIQLSYLCKTEVQSSAAVVAPSWQRDDADRCDGPAEHPPFLRLLSFQLPPEGQTSGLHLYDRSVILDWSSSASVFSAFVPSKTNKI